MVAPSVEKLIQASAGQLSILFAENRVPWVYSRTSTPQLLRECEESSVTAKCSSDRIGVSNPVRTHGTAWTKNQAQKVLVSHDDFTAKPESWPALPLEAWQDTYATLHMWTQIVGKVRLALSPLINHWWEVPLYVSARGLLLPPFRIARHLRSGIRFSRSQSGHPDQRRLRARLFRWRRARWLISTKNSWPRWRRWALR